MAGRQPQPFYDSNYPLHLSDVTKTLAQTRLPDGGQAWLIGLMFCSKHIAHNRPSRAIIAYSARAGLIQMLRSCSILTASCSTKGVPRGITKKKDTHTLDFDITLKWWLPFLTI